MSKVNMVVLGFLTDKPLYGYEIKEILESRHMDHWAGIKLPAVYKALHILEDQGFISGEKEEGENNLSRTVYTIQPNGKRYLRQLVEKYLEKPADPKDLWLAIAFSPGMTTRDFFLRQIDRAVQQLGTENVAHEQCWQAYTDGQKDIPITWATILKLGIEMTRVAHKILSELHQSVLAEENRTLFIAEGK